MQSGAGFPTSRSMSAALSKINLIFELPWSTDLDLKLGHCLLLKELSQKKSWSAFNITGLKTLFLFTHKYEPKSALWRRLSLFQLSKSTPAAVQCGRERFLLWGQRVERDILLWKRARATVRLGLAQLLRPICTRFSEAPRWRDATEGTRIGVKWNIMWSASTSCGSHCAGCSLAIQLIALAPYISPMHIYLNGFGCGRYMRSMMDF